MRRQAIESTKVIKFLDESRTQAKMVGKKDKAKALDRAYNIVYGYYQTQDGFAPEAELNAKPVVEDNFDDMFS